MGGAIGIQKEGRGPRTAETATAIAALADFYREQGDTDKASEAYLRALEIRQKVLQPGDPVLIGNLDVVAGLHDADGDLDQALPLYAMALAQREKSLGESHPDVIENLLSLASSHQRSADLVEAERYYLRALAAQEKAFGANSAALVPTLDALVVVLSDLGRNSEATRLDSRARNLRSAATSSH